MSLIQNDPCHQNILDAFSWRAYYRLKFHCNLFPYVGMGVCGCLAPNRWKPVSEPTMTLLIDAHMRY